MTREEEVAYFRSIETGMDAMSTDWKRAMTPEGDGIVARLIPQQAPEPVLVFDVYAHKHDAEAVENFPAWVRFLIDLVRRLDRENRALRPPPEPKPADHTKKCCTLCGDKRFQRFLHEQHGLDNHDDPIRVESRVRSLLTIGSRAQLNTDPEAAKRWLKMVEDYDKWRYRK